MHTHFLEWPPLHFRNFWRRHTSSPHLEETITHTSHFREDFIAALEQDPFQHPYSHIISTIILLSSYHHIISILAYLITTHHINLVLYMQLSTSHIGIEIKHSLIMDSIYACI